MSKEPTTEGAELSNDVSGLRGWRRARHIADPVTTKLPTRRVTINLDEDIVAIFKAEALQGGPPYQVAINQALRESIAYAQAHQEEALAYALEYGRGIRHDVGDLFVRMYVNEDTIDLGEEGVRALELLYCRAAKKRLLSAPKTLRII